jgi:hypothetical protein
MILIVGVIDSGRITWVVARARGRSVALGTISDLFFFVVCEVCRGDRPIKRVQGYFF